MCDNAPNLLLLTILLVTVVRTECMVTYYTSIVGDDAVLECGLVGEPGGHIVWRAGDRVVFAGGVRIRRDKRLAVVNNHLVISGLRDGDGGEYTCETETLSGDVVMLSMYLNVLSPPSVTIVGGDGVVTVKYGARLELTCLGKGVPAPLVSWVVGGDAVVTDTGTATLELDGVGYDDGGEVICVADNGVGDPVTDSVTINIFGNIFFNLLLNLMFAYCRTSIPVPFKILLLLFSSSGLFSPVFP